eukprot:gene10424-10582_t
MSKQLRQNCLHGPHMGVALLLVLLQLAVIATAARSLQQSSDPQVVFFPDTCNTVCSTSQDFHLPLPSAPNLATGNRATQWGVALLMQIREAVRQGKTSPPYVARTLAVYSTAVYDAVAVLKRNMQPVHTTAAARQPNASNSKAGVQAAISGAAYTAIKALLPPGPTSLDTLLASMADNTKQPAAFQTGVAAANQVLAARANDGFNAPVPPNTAFPTPPVFPNPTMSTTVATNCSVTNIDSWQQLKVPTANVFSPGQDAVFPPASYASVTSKTQGFLAYAAAFAKPLSAPTAADLVGSTLAGPNMLSQPAQQAAFYAEMEQVLTLSASLDDVNKTIAELWADGPDSTFPPGHWYRIALEESELRGLTLEKTVVLMLAVGNAMQDAGIAAWYAKAKWFSSRPITALQCMHQGQAVAAWRGPYLGGGLRDGGTWQPYQPVTFVTPPFPAYISGHSTFSAAAARALTRFFNNNKIKGAKCYRAEAGSSAVEPKITAGQQGWVAGFTDQPSVNGGPGYAPGRPVVLCWDSFQDAANQSGFSRLLGGIHVAKDNDDGLLLGNAIGNKMVDLVNALAPGNL